MALVGAQAFVRTAPSGRMVRTSANGQVPPEPSLSSARALELARAIDRMSRRGLFRPRCLARSLALQRLLESEGFSGTKVHVGVRQVRGSFEAHAWVTLEGRVIGDEAAFVERFNEMNDVRIGDLR